MKKHGNILIGIIILLAVATVVISGAVLLSTNSILGTSEFVDSIEAKYVTKSGAEDGLLRVLRTPSFIGNYSVPIDQSSVNVVITGASSKVMTVVNSSTNYLQKYVRKFITNVLISNNVMTVQSYSETQ